jgi:hypothetical protein
MGLRDVLERFFAPKDDAVSTPRGVPTSEVMARHAEKLMRMKGVMSVGVGTTDAGEPAIVVGIDDPRAASVGDIPDSLEGVPVIHHRIGRPEAQD